MENIITTLNGLGFVKVLLTKGSDEYIVETARVTTQSDKTEIKSLIRYLLRNNHLSPFEFATIDFQIKAPIFVARQLFRHRSAKFAEQSGRYTELDTVFYNAIEADGVQREDINDHCYITSELYQELIQNGITKEKARTVLPLSTMTNFRISIDLRNLMNLLLQRMDSKAQAETREYAHAMFKFFKEFFPLTAQAFQDYQLNAQTFSAMELEIMKEFLYRTEFETHAKYDPKNKMYLNKMSFNEITDFFKKLEL